MSNRHKAIKATLDKGYATEWNDDHIADFGDEVDIYCNLVTPALSVNWDTSKTGGASVPVISFVDHHAFAYLNSSNGAGDYSLMKYSLGGAAGNITHINDNPVINMAVWMDAYAATGKTAEFGLLDNAVAPFTANQDGAYFRINANVLYAVTGTGAAETVTNLGAAPEYGNYRIRLTATHSYFYVNSMQAPVADHTTNLPDSDLTMAFAARCDAGTITKMYVDGCALKRLRYQG